MHRLDIKPLSVNQAWIGKTRKTKEFRRYQSDVVTLLRPLTIPDGPLSIYVQWGLSSMGGDVDNPLKPFLDCLQARYSFNDNRIYRVTVEKVKVPKGKEYIEFEIKEMEKAA